MRMNDGVDTTAPIELDPPEGVIEARQSVELLRAWIGDGALLVSLHSDAFADHVEEWGRLLAQIGHHVAKAVALRGDMSEHEARTALMRGFEAMHGAHEPTLSGKMRGRVTN